VPARSRRAPGATGQFPTGGGTDLRTQSRVLLRLAGPIVLSQLGVVGMNTVDTIMVAPLGPESLAAIGLAAALHMAAIMVFTGILLGASPLVSQAFGRGDRERCRTVLLQGLWLSAVLSLPVIWFSVEGGRIARALGQEPALSAVVGDYLLALAPGVPAALAFMVFRQFLEGMNRTSPPMVMTFIGLAVNAGANAVLIYGIPGWWEGMGVVGCGVATTLVRWAMVVAMVIYLARHPDLHPLRGATRRPEAGTIRDILRIGTPIGAQLGLEVGLFSFAAVMMGWFGPLALGSHQVTINIASTTFMVALGVSLAGSIRVGQEVGLGRPDAVRSATLATYLWALLFMAACAAIFFAIPGAVIAIYTRDPEIVALGSQLLLMAALFQVFDGAQVAGLCVLRGAADTRVPMLIAAVAYWGIGITSAYLLGFPLGLGPVGVWAGLCAGLAAGALLLGWRVRAVLWRRESR
jgi:multidrug resistance protein, MATE family